MLDRARRHESGGRAVGSTAPAHRVAASRPSLVLRRDGPSGGRRNPRAFEQADAHRFPGLHLSWQALNAPEGTTAVLNAANEVAVEAFLAERLRFDHIHAVNLATLEAVPSSKSDSLESLLGLDAQARDVARRIAASMAL